MSTYIAYLRGVNFRPVDAQAAVLELSDGDELFLEREYNNPHDPNAIKVLHPENGLFLGYVAKEIAAELAPEIDADMAINCVVDMAAGRATTLKITSTPVVFSAATE